MVVEKYFYKTIIEFANYKGYTMKQLAAICKVKPETLDRQLQRISGSNITSITAEALRDSLAPHVTLDKLYPEARREAERRIKEGDESQAALHE